MSECAGRLHRVLALITRERQCAERQVRGLGGALDVLDAAAVGDCQDVRHWPVWKPLLPHLTRVFGHCTGPGGAEPLARLLNNVAALLMRKARYDEAEPLMRRALAIDEGIYESLYPAVARGLNNLAQLLKATKRLAEAEPLLSRALTIDEEAPDTLVPAPRLPGSVSPTSWALPRRRDKLSLANNFANGARAWAQVNPRLGIAHAKAPSSLRKTRGWVPYPDRLPGELYSAE